MGDYSESTDFYDLLHAGGKDYATEAAALAELIREAHASARTVLDVGCGTGRHARALTDLGFEVDGVDIEPDFVATSSARCPDGTFRVADMRSLELPDRYDAIVCLYSVIGYVRDLAALYATIAGFAQHLAPDGVVVVDPWFEPGELSDGLVSVETAETEDFKGVRMSRNVIEGDSSRLEFEYLIGSPSGIEHRSEVHRLGLFSQNDMESAFRDAGLKVERRRGVVRRRGVYIGRR